MQHSDPHPAGFHACVAMGWKGAFVYAIKKLLSPGPRNCFHAGSENIKRPLTFHIYLIT